MVLSFVFETRYLMFMVLMSSPVNQAMPICGPLVSCLYLRARPGIAQIKVWAMPCWPTCRRLSPSIARWTFIQDVSAHLTCRAACPD
jgi:hypothetical protein